MNITMKTNVAQWGNSLALRLPKKLAEELGITKPMEVDMRVEEGRLVVSPRAETLEELLEQIAPDMVHQEQGYDEHPVGKELW